MRAVSPSDPPPAPRKRPVPPPPADRQATADTLEWSEPAQPRTGRSVGIIVAIMASLLALGLGYAAWQQWQAREDTVASLIKTRAQLESVTQERKRAQLSLADAQRQGAEQQHRIEQDDGELSELH